MTDRFEKVEHRGRAEHRSAAENSQTKTPKQIPEGWAVSKAQDMEQEGNHFIPDE